jgi:hypothetical protein
VVTQRAPRAVKLGCDLANVPRDAVDEFRASADRLFAGAMEQVKELAVAYAEGVGPPQPIAASAACSGPHSLAARAARCVSDPTSAVSI